MEKIYLFMPLLLSTYVPLGQLIVVIILGVITILEGLLVIYLYFIREKKIKKQNK